MPAELTITEHCGDAVVRRRIDVPCARLLELIAAEGDTLQISPTTITRRVGQYVVKACSREPVLGVLKRTLRRERYRRGWVAGLYLEQLGIGAPRVDGLVEQGRWGIIRASYLIMEYLEGANNVERCMAEMVQDGAPEERLRTFLHDLAQTVNALRDAGAYHRDLSGKNIFTRNGEKFYFIDLDSIVPVKRYSRGMLYANHVQLYDSFCDFLGDDLLDSFIALMLPDEEDYATWVKQVRRGQAERRSRQLAIWRKQGRSL
ncbi:MAG TPA: lipopolysaccharide kinase InaA family protein [Candidatus Hydrogenedentes bacterium]|nr:lipopolysaccharide kinase InaA family protein [Candidatus Hydrogenedentota bacterium]